MIILNIEMIADPTCLSLDLTDKHEKSSVTHECKLTKNECVLAAFKSLGRMAWQRLCLFMACTMIRHISRGTDTCDKRYKRGLLPFIHI